MPHPFLQHRPTKIAVCTAMAYYGLAGSAEIHIAITSGTARSTRLAGSLVEVAISAETRRACRDEMKGHIGAPVQRKETEAACVRSRRRMS